MKLQPEAVLDLIGKPHQLGARGPDAFDCWGLCAEVYRRAGRILPDYRAEHLTRAQAAALAKGLAPDHADWIDDPEPWCFVFVRRTGHMGLFCFGRVLHSAPGLGVVLQRLEQFEALHRGIAFARWRD